MVTCLLRAVVYPLQPLVGSKQGRPGMLVGAAPQILLARFPQGSVFFFFFGFWLGFGPWLSRAESVEKEKALIRHLEV